MTDFNDLLQGMHNDKVRVLRDQLAAIDKQETERQGIAAVIKGELQGELDEVRAEELRVTPDWTNAQDQDRERQARITFLQKRWDLMSELQRELRNCWLDHQRLEEERRAIEKELTTLQNQSGRTSAS